MDTAEQARAYAAADFSEPHDAFVNWFRDRFPEFRSGRVLDLGCGTADVTVRFARAFPDVRIHGIDGAPAMLDEGTQLVRSADLGERVSLELVRLPSPTLNGAAYDAMVSNSLLHHLTDPGVLWETVASTARAGAPVFVMDLCRPASTEVAQHLVDMYAAGESLVLRDDFYRSLCAAYTPDEVKAQLTAAAVDAFRVEPVGDRHLLVWGTR